MKMDYAASIVSVLCLCSLTSVTAQWPFPGGPGGGRGGPGGVDYGGGGGGNPCGSSQISVSGTGRVNNLTSPDWPYHYANQLACTFYISTSYGKKIYMYIAFFEVERSYDTLTIGKGNEPHDPRTKLVALSGSIVRLKRLWMPSHLAWMEFETDTTRTMRGYVISLQAVSSRGTCVGDREVKCQNNFCIDYRGRCDGYDDCGDNSDESENCNSCPSNNHIEFTGSATRKLLWTPGYPTRYPNNLKCIWTINSTIPNTRVSAYIEDFNLEEMYDWWTAGFGADVHDSRTVLVKLSGPLVITRVISPSNTMWIQFKSDSRVNKAGFWLYIQPIAGKDNCTDYGNYFQCDNDFCIQSSSTCDGYNDCLDNSDETKCEKINCGQGRYWCEGEPYCIRNDYICDGIQHCTSNNDEENCDKQKCPENCMCYYRTEMVNGDTKEFLVVNCTVGWYTSKFTTFPKQIETMMMSGSPIQTLPSSAVFRNFSYMRYLSLKANAISRIESGAFMGLDSLIWLDLSKNHISRIDSNSFLGLAKLEVLIMYKTPLTYVEANGLDGLDSLKTWFLHRNLHKGRSVDIGNYLYDPRTGYTYGDPTYTGVKGIQNLYVDDYRLCCYMDFVEAKQCQSTKKMPQFFDCGDLLKHDAIKVCLWLVNLVGVVANLILIEIRYRNYNRIGRLCIPSFMFGNLALSGVFMGVYCLMLGFTDLSNTNANSFFVNSDQWRESVKCKAAGSVSLIATQSLVFILTTISVERFIKVMYPESKYVMSVRAAKVAMVFCWTLAFILGVSIPFLSEPETYGWTDTCLGLPVHRLHKEYYTAVLNLTTPAGGYEIRLPTPDLDRDEAAWPLSIALFLVIDPLCLIIGLVLFLIIKYKGEHEVLPVDEDEEEDEDEIKKKPVVIDVDAKEPNEKNQDGCETPSTAQADSSDGCGTKAVPNQYEDPVSHVYETLNENKTEKGKEEGEGDKDDEDDESNAGDDGGAVVADMSKFKTKQEKMNRKMSKRKSGKKVRVLKGSKAMKKSLKKKTTAAPGDQIATITDGIVLPPEDPIIIDGITIRTSEKDESGKKFMTLDGTDMVMNKDDADAGDEASNRDKEGEEQVEKKKKRRRRRKRKQATEGTDDAQEKAEGEGDAQEKAEGENHAQKKASEEEGDDKGQENDDGEEGTGSEWETDTSASDESSSDEETGVEIEERKITSKSLANKMMRLFVFNLITLSPLFVTGILSQAGVIDMPLEFTYWAALFILPFLTCLNPFVICCVDIGGIRPKYEWQFDEVSYSETLSEKRERIAREALTFL